MTSLPSLIWISTLPPRFELCYFVIFELELASIILLRDLKVVVRDLFDFCLTTGFRFLYNDDFLDSDIEFELLDIESDGECSIDELS